MDTESKTWYFTFGLGTDLSDCYTTVRAPSEDEAREIFLRERRVLANPRLGWSSVYSEAEFAALRRQPSTKVAVTTPVLVCSG